MTAYALSLAKLSDINSFRTDGSSKTLVRSTEPSVKTVMHCLIPAIVHNGELKLVFDASSSFYCYK